MKTVNIVIMSPTLEMPAMPFLMYAKDLTIPNWIERPGPVLNLNIDYSHFGSLLANDVT